MFAFGPTRTSLSRRVMSAIGGKADTKRCKADMGYPAVLSANGPSRALGGGALSFILVAMQKIKCCTAIAGVSRRHEYGFCRTPQKAGRKVRWPGDANARRREPPTVSAVGADVSSPCGRGRAAKPRGECDRWRDRNQARDLSCAPFGFSLAGCRSIGAAVQFSLATCHPRSRMCATGRTADFTNSRLHVRT